MRHHKLSGLGDVLPPMDPNAFVPGTGGSAGFSYQQNPIAAIGSGVPINFDTGGMSLSQIVSTALNEYNLTREQQAFLQQNQQLIAAGQPPISYTQFLGQTSAGQAVAGGINLSPTMMLFVLGIVGLVVFGGKRHN